MSHSDLGLKRNAAICILSAQEKFLFIERNKAPNRGKYVPIGGKVDPHESPSDTAIREIYEESGRVVSDVKLLGVLVETSPIDYNWTSFVFQAEVPYFDPPLCDEGKLVWLTMNELDDVATPPTTLPIFEALIQQQYFIFEAKYDSELHLLSLVNHLTI